VRVQAEAPPYKYVSVERPVVAIEPADLERDRRPLAHRYLGAQRGDRYIEKTRLEYVGNVVVACCRDDGSRWTTRRQDAMTVSPTSRFSSPGPAWLARLLNAGVRGQEATLKEAMCPSH
jgi:hypothetical protein